MYKVCALCCAVCCVLWLCAVDVCCLVCGGVPTIKKHGGGGGRGLIVILRRKKKTDGWQSDHGKLYVYSRNCHHCFFVCFVGSAIQVGVTDNLGASQT